MDEGVLHRKRVRHYDLPGHAHELTFSCYQRLPLLRDSHPCLLLSRALDAALNNHAYRLIAFVFMPEHVHLLVFPASSSGSSISDLLFALKRPHSFRVKQWMTERADPLLDQLTVRERPGKTAFRFWQEGPGYDRNITNPAAIDDVIHYINHNPVRRKLCDHPTGWKWSSFRFHETGEVDPDLPTLTPSVS
jgi:putative transposase